MQSQYLTHIYGVISIIIGFFGVYASGWSFSDRLLWLSFILVILSFSFIYILNKLLLIIDKKTDEIKQNIETAESLKYELKSAKQEIESFKNITSFLAAEKITTTAKRKSNK
ncbi:hypothetical protein [Acinetobacter brisouii]|uniref:hypothetical protein n=1 Tax=Acinetobacter brisouii TaxID=396323 RepID=UPI0005F821C9|nr:hypothetical protein [Acinetobacter brisouii]KJV38208.1 hypothetical protein VH98_10145 [Acinetobacter brisouii]